MTLMEDLILATDVSRHKDFMAHFEVLLQFEENLIIV